MNGKLSEFQKKIEENEFSAFLISNVTNVYYFVNFLSHSYAYLIVYPDESPMLLVPELEYEDALNSVKTAEIVKIDRNTEVLDALKVVLEDKQINELGFEEDSMTVKFYFDFTEKCEFLQMKKGSALIEELRITKIPQEIEKIRKACQIAEIGFSTAINSMDEGKTEIEIAAEVEYAMRKEGSEATPFDTIIASGYRSAYPHGTSSHKKIERGDLIIIDLGAKYEGYCSDMTRTVVFGEPSQKQLDVYRNVLKAHHEAIKECSIGKKAVEIEEITRKILSKEGYNEYFVHSLGHGVGLDVHEAPHIAKNSQDILHENTVFTIEPGVYIPGFGGVRIEDVVVLTKQGAKCLTKADYSIKME